MTRWIKACLESSFVSVLVNGSPTKEFIPHKGLRQGDPLAPFLFLNVVEGLAGVSRNVVELNLVESLAIENKKIKRNFLWGWGSEGRKIARVSWKKVCEPRDVEGLDIMDIRLFNSALLRKWIWRLHSRKGGLWKQILESKYGGWRSLKESRVYNKDSLWWRDLKGI
ncbi:uncharacterized protein [Phaseolus vulgaris]|uniref:uncharacterized protein n=1 Tax=Phaseolus vulgaris TaxID=3885 RepID=UPI0035CC6C11